MNPASKAKAAAYVAAVFLVGALAGGFVGFDLGRRAFFRPPDPRAMAERVMEWLQSDLALTEEQAGQIRPIVEAGTAEAEKIHHETFERIRALMERDYRRIEPFLTPDQQKRLREHEHEHRGKAGVPKIPDTNATPPPPPLP